MKKDDAVYCEVCRLPHRAGIVACQGCGHTLGKVPDWDALREKIRFHKRMALLAAVFTFIIFLPLAITLVKGGSAVYSFLPLIWLGYHLYQNFTLRALLPAEVQDKRSP